MSLTNMQKRYIWLAGIFPHHVIVQGRGKRGDKVLYYAIEDEFLYLFGYSNPLHWLCNRGLFRRLQDGRAHALTEAGEKEFSKMVLRGYGEKVASLVKEAKLG